MTRKPTVPANVYAPMAALWRQMHRAGDVPAKRQMTAEEARRHPKLLRGAAVKRDVQELRQEAGHALRQLRKKSGLTIREVEDKSLKLCLELNRTEFRVLKSRLSEFEMGAAVPTIFRLWALARIYGTSMQKLARLYEIPC